MVLQVRIFVKSDKLDIDFRQQWVTIYKENRIFASLESHGELEQLNLSYYQFHGVQVDAGIGSGLFMLRN